MTRPLTPPEQAALDLWALWAQAGLSIVTEAWRRQRARDRENLGLPPWEREDRE